MAGKGFSVKVQLELHAVTCPGVWLCPNGKVALQINTLNSSIQSHKVTPTFPLLFHDKFTFKKIFTRVNTLKELQNDLEEEFFYAELVQWSPPSNRRIILATFETNLVDLLYPATCSKGLLAGVDVDLLMEPTNHFPGIIAPKIEVSTKTTIEEVVGVCNLDAEAHVVNPKTIYSKTTSCIHRKPPVKGIIRQKKVCHGQGRPRTQPSRLCTKPPTVKNCCACLSNQHAQTKLQNCYHKTKQSSCEASGKRPSKSYTVCDDSHVFDKCPVCLKYKCYFSKCKNDDNDDDNDDHHQGRREKSKLLQEIRGTSGDTKCNCRSSTAYIEKEEPYRSTISILRSKIKDLQRGKEKDSLSCTKSSDNINVLDDDDDDDGYDYCEGCKGCHEHKPRYYKNLEKFYKRLYKRAKMRMHRDECI